MIRPSELSKEENYKLIDQIIELRMSGVSASNIHACMDVPRLYVLGVIKRARVKGYEFPNISPNKYSNAKKVSAYMQLEPPDLSHYTIPKFTPPTTTIQETKPVTKNFYFTKDFDYLFK